MFVSKGFNAARSIVCVETGGDLSTRRNHREFQCRTQHCVCRDCRRRCARGRVSCVSMPHAALCVSRHDEVYSVGDMFDVSMPHAALCVSRPAILRLSNWVPRVSMPHAALCVSRLKETFDIRRKTGFQCRTQHCVCRDKALNEEMARQDAFQCRTQHCVCRDCRVLCITADIAMFQCRTQHCVCRDAVSRSPCPARAEKAFWKDALFCAVFGVCG